jgi:hypothetical protein
MQTPYSEADDQDRRLKKHKIKIEEIERTLDMLDRRMLTSENLNLFAEELRGIIQDLGALREQSVRRSIIPIEVVLKILRAAQNELYIALDMFEARSKFTESKRRSFYKCLNNFQEYLYQAIRYFNDD